MASSTSRAASTVGARTSIRARGLGRDHAREMTPVDRSDVDGDSAFVVVQRKQPLDLVRELEDRADALLGARAAVCRPAVHLQAKPADPLAPGLQLALRSRGRLEDECAAGAARQLPHERRGLDAAGLLVRVHEQDRRDGRCRSGRAQRSKCERELDEPALHVVRAGAVEACVVDSRHHLADRPGRPHRVDMPDDQLSGGPYRWHLAPSPLIGRVGTARRAPGASQGLGSRGRSRALPTSRPRPAWRRRAPARTRRGRGAARKRDRAPAGEGRALPRRRRRPRATKRRDPAPAQRAACAPRRSAPLRPKPPARRRGPPRG